MKRFLKMNPYTLQDHEKESLWISINQKTRQTEQRNRHHRNFAPVFGLTTALTVAVVLALFLRPESPPREVASHNPDQASVVESQLPMVDPAQIRGQVLDRSTGQPLANANVLLDNGRGLTTDSLGRFQLDRLDPEQALALKVKYLGYDDAEAQPELSPGQKLELKIEMDPMVVATLEAFDVEGAEYMVEVRSAITEHSVTSDTFEKFAISSVQDAMNKNAGVVSRAGEPSVRGGRSAEVSYQMDSVTGGTKAPNAEVAELMYFEHSGTNPFEATEEDSLSTFAVDVDNASYTMARRYIENGALPPKAAVRVEEFVNFFDAGYPSQQNETFAIHIDGSPSRFGSGYHQLRIGLKGRDLDGAERKPANLVFLVDISGSMDQNNRLELVKSSLLVLLNELQEGDRVGLIVYGSKAEVRLLPTDLSSRQKIRDAITRLRTNGATNAYDGLSIAYQMARDYYQAHKLNRIVLCSDGVANLGSSTKAETILEDIRQASDSGITLSTIGFGMGNYNDIMMEKLANLGDGNYYYVDGPEEAERVFRENLTGLLQTIARQVKIQVAFNPSVVQRWRLLGYENRDVADRDFRNDKVDAGEVGVGHQVTALYELKLEKDSEGLPLGEVRVRYEFPAHETDKAGQVEEISRPITADQLSAEFGDAETRGRLLAVAAEFAEILRGSHWAKESQIKDLVPVIDGLAEELAEDDQVQELASLIHKAADIEDKHR